MPHGKRVLAFLQRAPLNVLPLRGKVYGFCVFLKDVAPPEPAGETASVETDITTDMCVSRLKSLLSPGVAQPF